MQLANFKGITVRQSEVNRLKMELDGKKVSFSEGVTAEEWQQYYNVNLERYNPEIHKILVDGNPADFAIIDSNKRPDEWTIIDFMFTMESSNEKGIKAMNYSLDGHKRHKRNWYDLEQQMLDHLEKSDIVPMDLRHWNIKNRIKILNFVLSLNKELQEKIVFIGG